MAVRSPEEAVRECQRLLSLGQGVPGTAFLVRRLDKPRSDYFLVHTGGHVVCLEAASGALMSSAKAAHSPVTLTREAALQHAGAKPDARAELVWSPSPASLSMFYPFWAVTDEKRTVYVNQKGSVSETLERKQPGGGPAYGQNR